MYCMMGESMKDAVHFASIVLGGQRNVSEAQADLFWKDLTYSKTYFPVATGYLLTLAHGLLSLQGFAVLGLERGLACAD